MATMKKEFVEGALALGTPRKAAEEIFDLIEKFASYGFNKSHSVAYSMIAYQTAYLKANFPAQFMAATLSSEMGDTDKIVKFIDDCRKSGISVLPPDVNESDKGFRVVGSAIRFGLLAIKNVGEGAIESIIATREAGGKFENIFDFSRRVDLRLANKKCLESLIQAGAFDSVPGHRAQHYENIERATAFGQASQNHGAGGQHGLFDSLASKEALAARYPAMVDAAPWSELDKLAKEKAVLGFYVSGHPLRRYEREIHEFANVRLGDVSRLRTGSSVRLCGIVTSVKKKIDKRNNTMAFVGIEDFTGKGECIVFSDAYSKYHALLQPDAMVMVTGRGEPNGDALKIVVNEVLPMDSVRERFTRSVILSISIPGTEENAILRLRQLMEECRGNIPCFFRVREDSGTRLFQSRRFTVEPSEKFAREVSQVLGPESIRFSSEQIAK
jgi:DNA polymerase-3 subunit alpha